MGMCNMQKKGRLVHHPPKFLSGDFSLNFCFTSFPARKEEMGKKKYEREWKKILLVEGKRFENKTWEAMGIPLYFFLSHTPLSFLQAFLGGSRKKEERRPRFKFFSWMVLYARFTRLQQNSRRSLFLVQIENGWSSGIFRTQRVLKGVCHLLVPLEYPENIPRVHFREFLEKFFWPNSFSKAFSGKDIAFRIRPPPSPFHRLRPMVLEICMESI